MRLPLAAVARLNNIAPPIRAAIKNSAAPNNEAYIGRTSRFTQTSFRQRAGSWHPDALLRGASGCKKAQALRLSIGSDDPYFVQNGLPARHDSQHTAVTTRTMATIAMVL
jgi:hypothetical protein